MALEIVEATKQCKPIIFCDSMPCLQAVYYHKIENPGILDILEKCHNLTLLRKEVQFCWVPSHVGIRGTEIADAAAKAALQLPVSPNIKLPYTDLKHSVITYFVSKWQNQWNRML